MLYRSLILTITATCLLNLTACQNDENKQTETQTTTTTTEATATETAGTKTAPPTDKPVQAVKSSAKDPNFNPNKDPEFIKAMQALEANHIEEAIKGLDLVLKKHPDDMQSLNNRGVAYMRMGKAEPALKDFNLAIQLYPDRASSYYNRASLKIAQKQDPLSDLSKTLSLDPTCLPALYDRANYYFMQKRLDKATQDLNQILKYAPKNPDTYNFRGFLNLQQEGKLKEALNDFDQALKLNPKFAVAMANKAQTLYKMGKCKESIDWLKKSCQAGHQKGCQLLKQIKCK